LSRFFPAMATAA